LLQPRDWHSVTLVFVPTAAFSLILGPLSRSVTPKQHCPLINGEYLRLPQNAIMLRPVAFSAIKSGAGRRGIIIASDNQKFNPNQNISSCCLTCRGTVVSERRLRRYIVSIFLIVSQLSWEIEVGQPPLNKVSGLFKRCSGLKQIAITRVALLHVSPGSLCPVECCELGSSEGACPVRAGQIKAGCCIKTVGK
jgi:hypothetical protein